MICFRAIFSRDLQKAPQRWESKCSDGGEGSVQSGVFSPSTLHSSSLWIRAQWIMFYDMFYGLWVFRIPDLIYKNQPTESQFYRFMKRNCILHRLAKGQLIWGRRLLWVPLRNTKVQRSKNSSFLLLAAVKHEITSYQPSPSSDNLLSNPGLSGIYSLDFVRKRTKTRSMIRYAPKTAHILESSKTYKALFN